MLQGFAFTLVPSLATVFSATPYGVDARAFGALFVPLTLGATAAAAATPFLARWQGMAGILRLGVFANIGGLVALISSPAVGGHEAYLLLLIDTTALGIGFGLNFAAVNELAAGLSKNATLGITLANVLTGMGTALTPLIVGVLAAHELWPVWPAALALAFVCVFVLSYGWKTLPRESVGEKRRPLSRALILFGVAALLYAFCEGVFSSWATTFVHIDRGYSLATGEAALSGFWLALTGTRLIAAFTTRALPPRSAFVLFSVAIALALFLLPLWAAPAALVGGFVFGGIACSIVFPYAMSLALAALPADRDRVAGLLVAALMTGEGGGTFVVGLLHGNAGIPLPSIYRWAAGVALALAIVATLARRASPESAVKASS